MTEEEVLQIVERLRERRLFDEIFVLILERENGELKLLDYGMKDIGDVAAWIAVQKQKQKPSSEGDKA